MCVRSTHKFDHMYMTQQNWLASLDCNHFQQGEEVYALYFKSHECKLILTDLPISLLRGFMINEEAKPLRNMTRGMVAMYFCKREDLSFDAFVDELGVVLL